MKKKLCLLAVLSLMLLSFELRAQKDGSKFKVVGYYSMKAAMTADLKSVPFDKLTHINLYPLDPDTLGNYNQDLSRIIPFIKAAHAQNVKVLPTIGGGGNKRYYGRLLQDDKRAKLIDDLLAITLKYDFDGIDVDLEGRDIDGNYENLAVGLAAALKPKGKLLTAAIAIFYKDALTDKALAQYDFVNIMSYDHTGPWKPSKPGPHSTYEHAVADLDYFGSVRNIPKEKMVLGVGFYGYGFGPDLVTPGVSLTYNTIVKTYPGAENSDQVNMPGDKIMYYNGVPTIIKKTQLAKEKASGIMIWQVLGDAPDGRSLLKAIFDEAYGISKAGSAPGTRTTH